MIATLVKEINDATSLNWMEKSYPLTFAAVVKPPSGTASINLPFAWGEADCNENSAVVPDERYRCVSFFESGPVLHKERTEGGIYMNGADLRWIFWCNLNKIDHENPYVCDILINQVENAVVGMKGIFGDYRIHRTSIKSVVIDSKTILGKYGYKDVAKQTIHPFFVFALDFTVIFTATNRCETITLNPKC